MNGTRQPSVQFQLLASGLVRVSDRKWCLDSIPGSRLLGKAHLWAQSTSAPCLGWFLGLPSPVSN